MTRELALALVVVASVAEADHRTPARGVSLSRGCRDRSCVRGRFISSSSASLPPTFSFSPSFGPTACACDGSDAPGLVFDGGGAYCTKHNEVSSIAVGDLVFCPANQPRIMPGGDGGGALGVQIWADRTNPVKRSQAFDHADWVKGSNVVAVPTVAANQCLAPDGTMTADLVHFPAVTASALEYAFLLQDTCGLTYDVRTIYARTANWDAGHIAIDGGTLSGRFIINDGTPELSANCSHNGASYTRCRQYDVDAGQVGIYFYFGINGSAGAFEDQYVCLWQADCQANMEQSLDPWPPPIPTVAAAVTKGGDVAWYDRVLMPQLTNYSLSATLVTESGYQSASGGPYTLFEATTPAGAGGSKVLRSAAKAMCSQGADAFAVAAYSTNTLTEGAAAYSCSYNGAPVMTESPYVIACSNQGNCGDGGPLDAGVAIATRFAIGSRWNTFDYVYWANGVVKDISATSQARKDLYLFGDSIVEGNTAGDGFQPQYVLHRVRGNAVAPTNEGVSAENSAQCRARFLARLNVVVDAGVQRRSYFMLQCGHNGSPDAGCVNCGAGIGVLGDLTDALKRAQDAGAYVIGSTIVPDVSAITEIATINSALQTWGQANGISIANTFSALENPASPGSLLPAYDIGDHVHLNDAGTYVETIVWLQTGGW